MPIETHLLTLVGIAALTVYLSGPKSGKRLHSFPAFAEASATLQEAGLTVRCPNLAERFNAPHYEEGFDTEATLRHDLEVLMGCDAVVFLAGSWRSADARADYEMARALGLRIFSYHDGALIESSAAEVDAFLMDQLSPHVAWRRRVVASA